MGKITSKIFVIGIWSILCVIIQPNFWGSSAYGATYYVATTGNDANAGTETAPFKTIQRAADIMQAGDTTYVRAGTYHEEINPKNSGTEGNYISYLAYPGERPVIDGSIELTGWTACSSQGACGNNPNWQHIYYTKIPDGVFPLGTLVYENDTLLKLCQDPNQPDDFYNDDRDFFRDIPFLNSSNASIVDAAYFIQADPQYWKEAYLYSYGGNNNVVEHKITAYDPAQHMITFAPPVSYDTTLYPMTKYSMLNHWQTLDAPKEYYIEGSGDARFIYLWPATEGDPNQKKITFTTLGKGFYLHGQGYIRIEGFEITKQAMMNGTDYRGGSGIINPAVGPVGTGVYRNLIIKNNVISKGRSSGISLTYCDNSVVDGNTISDRYGKGIILSDHRNSTIRNNTISRTGTAIDYYYTEDSDITNNTVTGVNGGHANGITAYLNCKNLRITGNKLFIPNIAFTFSDADTILVDHNLAVNKEGWHFAIWGTNVRNFTITNNTFVHYPALTGARNAMIVPDAPNNFIIRDNIIDGINGNTASRGYNLHTGLSWNQNPLGETEIYDQDLNKIFVNPEANDFRLNQGVTVGQMPKTADPCFMSSIGSYVGALLPIACETDAPVAIFSVDKIQGYEPLEVSFNASASLSCSSAITNYAWDFGDSRSGSGVTTKHTFARGLYTVRLSVTNNAGKTAMVEKVISVLPSAIPNLVLGLDFDNNALDYSGKNNNGSWQGAAAYTAGKFLGAAAMDGSGTGAYVLVNDSELLRNMQALTVSVWAKKNNAALGGELINKHVHYCLTLGQSSAGGYVGTTVKTDYFNTPAAINDTGWHHYVMAYDGAKTLLYVDGIELAQRPLTGTVTNDATRDVFIGKDPWGNTFNGAIDEVRIYDRALSAQEITDLFHTNPQKQTIYGDVSGDQEVTAYDAALTAQASVELITLAADQTKAADVSGDNEVTGYDAALIAQRAVGLIDKFPVEGL